MRTTGRRAISTDETAVRRIETDSVAVIAVGRSEHDRLRANYERRVKLEMRLARIKWRIEKGQLISVLSLISTLDKLQELRPAGDAAQKSGRDHNPGDVVSRARAADGG